MVTGIQIRLGRTALGWSIADLAEKAGLNFNTVQRMESAGSDEPGGYARNVSKVRDALQDAGVTFLDDDGTGGPGVRVKGQDDD